MREIRTSGSTRGQPVTIMTPAVLLYRSSAASWFSAYCISLLIPIQFRDQGPNTLFGVDIRQTLFLG